jgi:hypothetical protein
MRFRLVWYKTGSDNKWDAHTDRRHEYLGDLHSVWALWFMLTDKLGEKHVEVFNLQGRPCQPEQGLYGMVDYNL